MTLYELTNEYKRLYDMADCTCTLDTDSQERTEYWKK